MSEKFTFFYRIQGHSSLSLFPVGEQKVQISKMRGQLFVDNMVIIEDKNVPQWLLDYNNEASTQRSTVTTQTLNPSIISLLIVLLVKQLIFQGMSLKRIEGLGLGILIS